MKKNLTLLVWLIPMLIQAQALQEINYNYLYNPDESFSFTMKPVRTAGEWNVFFALQVNKPEVQVSRYAIEWERRSSLNRKEGEQLALDSLGEYFPTSASDKRKTGKISLKVEPSPIILTAKVIDIEAKKAWFFYEILRPNYPVNCFLENAANNVVFMTYLTTDDSFSVSGSARETLTVSRYKHDFPAAAPAFSEAMARVPGIIRADTMFSIQQDQQQHFSEEGLYLIQKDTSAAEGLAFNVYEDYPKYSKLENLVDPLIYISTKQEFERMKQTRGDKKSFDRIILGITSDADRAKNLIRSYFRRVELANQYFTSYKEGWKTDRGMIYIIFGQPDEVYKFADREVWNYKNSSYKLAFDFVRSATLFDPGNYVLIRNKKYRDTWYEVIDLWRNARF